MYVRWQDVAKEHKKHIHFEIDVVEDLLPVDVDEGVWAWRGEETEGQEGSGWDREKARAREREQRRGEKRERASEAGKRAKNEVHVRVMHKQG